MYIGPWQEFKLAKILQLKEKVERENSKDQRIDTAEGLSLSNGRSIGIRSEMPRRGRDTKLHPLPESVKSFGSPATITGGRSTNATTIRSKRRKEV